jgi:hypothetical protein
MGGERLEVRVMVLALEASSEFEAGLNTIHVIWALNSNSDFQVSGFIGDRHHTLASRAMLELLKRTACPRTIEEDPNMGRCCIENVPNHRGVRPTHVLPWTVTETECVVWLPHFSQR